MITLKNMPHNTTMKHSHNIRSEIASQGNGHQNCHTPLRLKPTLLLTRLLPVSGYFSWAWNIGLSISGSVRRNGSIYSSKDQNVFQQSHCRPTATNHRPSVLWHYWLGHLTRKIVSEMTCNVSSGTLNPTIPYPLQLKVEWSKFKSRMWKCRIHFCWPWFHCIRSDLLLSQTTIFQFRECVCLLCLTLQMLVFTVLTMYQRTFIP